MEEFNHFVQSVGGIDNTCFHRWPISFESICGLATAEHDVDCLSMKFLSVGNGVFVADSAIATISVKQVPTEFRNMPNPAMGFPNEPDTIKKAVKNKRLVTVTTVSGQKFDLDEGADADAFAVLVNP